MARSTNPNKPNPLQPESDAASAAPVVAALRAVPAEIARANWLVAYSGGLDSTVLLHAATRCAPGKLRVVHIHHGLQPQADAWATRGAETCAELGVAFDCRHISIDQRDPAGPEAAARRGRYDALRNTLAPDEILLTAQHLDDQAETLLLRLLRGSGVDGLAAMRPLTAFSPGWLWRPFLEVSRQQLSEYADHHGLQGVDDPHNADRRYTRAWLRQDILPALKARLPQVAQQLARAARLSAEASGLLAELAAIDVAQAGTGEALSVSALLRLTRPRRHNLLRFWLRQRGFLLPSADSMTRIDTEVLDAAPDAAPLFAWPGCELRRYRDGLHAMTPLPRAPSPDFVQAWTTTPRLELPPGCGHLLADCQPPIPLSIKFPTGGERFRRSNASSHRSLRNLFQEAGVPPWIRQRTPIIEIDSELVFVGGFGFGLPWVQCLPDPAIVWQMDWKRA